MGSWGHGLLGSDLGSWGQTWEAVQEFPLEIHKSLPSHGLRISSLIKVVSLLARTYGKKRRILGQPPRKKTLLELALGRPAGRSQGRGRRGESLPDAGERVGDVQVGEEREPRLGEVVIQRDPEVRAGPHGVVDCPGRVDAIARGGHLKRFTDRGIKPGEGRSRARADDGSEVATCYNEDHRA